MGADGAFTNRRATLSRSTARTGMIMTRFAPYVIAALALSLSACTNPYDPVQRGLGGGVLGAASGAAIGGGGWWWAGSRPRSGDLFPLDRSPPSTRRRAF